VELDPAMAQTLLDQKDSGKMLLLITNSDYEYTERMMTYAYDRFLPEGMKWRDLFDMVSLRLVRKAVNGDADNFTDNWCEDKGTERTVVTKGVQQRMNLRPGKGWSA
jgi:hypothetical protein